MTDEASDRSRKPATAARMYDYYLGGVHNFAADREAAEKIIAMQPTFPAIARANRAFLGRAVRFLAESGVRQFLDLGSGMPTVGNVHEIAQDVTPDARVVYVDIDPVAVSESTDILAGNRHVVAVNADMRNPKSILDHPQVRDLIDFSRPTAVLLAAVLHFVPDDDQAYGLVDELRSALAPGSYLLISHASTEGFLASSENVEAIKSVYSQQTATPGGTRSQAGVERFFAGTELVEPGVTWSTTWRPADGDPSDFADDPRLSCIWAAVGKVV
ncbi:SAM-dependent methyltransferase [Asanoa iriomotensis]|uniref:S-adenosyl methyltransferase n=1 Tax=Asanoa iriomotensis TaxID=234613 RepID=A0ABQ4BZ39_9ACTN|nr:SAM-dependent methyltransferase [Asanoa iriomotensis]GIF55801.1 hypothetical protein Air01nite_18960 [Asanoa iriomotensis]